MEPTKLNERPAGGEALAEPPGGARPSALLSHGGSVLRSAGFDDRPRWRDGERLEHLFERRVTELLRDGDGERVAVDGPHGRLSYVELDRRANQLARHLVLREGLAPGERIGLLFDRPVDAYVAMLAVLKLHAVYVPLDAGFPPERIAYIAADAGVAAILTERSLLPSLEQVPEATRVLALDEDSLEVLIAGERDDRLSQQEAPIPSDQLAYVIYTSGTTGRPKGVAVAHPSICNFVTVAAEVYGVRPHDRVYQGLTLAFDFAVEEIWVAFMVGATLVPKPSSSALLGRELAEFLLERRVSALCCVPTLLGTLDPEDLPGLRFLLVSGESCPADMVARWARPDRRFLNVYGPTEATVSATWTELHPGRPVTIGVPLPSYSCAVLAPDEDRLVRRGEAGELAIGGIGLAQGYLNRPDLTARAFIPDFLELAHNPSGRIYRTGDLVRVTPEGEIEHLGRIDTQVKIRGYRIELGEIESALRACPGVAQAIVDARCTTATGDRELVAWCTTEAGIARLDRGAIAARLRAELPPYMIPGHLVVIPRVPLMPSGKVDRHALPDPAAGGDRLAVAPQGARAAAGSAGAAGEASPGGAGLDAKPRTPLEAMLATELGEVLGVGATSADADFFAALGANSLVMARFVARVRERHPELAPIPMRAVYEHPNLRSLAAHLESSQATGTAWPGPEPAPAEPHGTPRPFLCGVLQLLSFVVYAGLAAWVLDAGAHWIFHAPGLLSGYLRAVALGAATLLGAALLPIAAKWVLLGRLTPRRVRVWSLAYLRFWIAKTLIVSNPLAHLMLDTPLYALYLRALGARVGGRGVFLSHHIPVGCELLQIGSETVIHKDAYLNGYRIVDGILELGAVAIGDRAIVGERALLEIDTAIGPDGQLGHASALQRGQRVPPRTVWYGSPARPAPAELDYRMPHSAPASRLRPVAFALGRLTVLALVLAPLEALVTTVLLTHPAFMRGLPGALATLVVPAAVLAVAIAGGLATAAGLGRLADRLLEPGRVYPLHGLHHGIQRLLSRVSNNSMLTGLLGDSVFIVHYLQAIGYRFGLIEQTGSNFGLDVKHEVPTLCHIGTGTMVSDGLSLMNAEFSSTAFRVRPVLVGRNTYLGNTVSFPAGARTGENCLLATKAMVPLHGPVREGIGLLGSPAFEIPRSVARDRAPAHLADPGERRLRLRAKTRHNLITMALHLLVFYSVLACAVAVAFAPLGGHGLTRWGGTLGSELLDLAGMFAIYILAERLVTGWRRLKPRECSILEPEFWAHERFWKVAPTNYVRILDGTPMKPWLWRALGVRIGRGVIDDGLSITERTLVEIGDRCTFNAGCHLQSHTLEDGLFKSDLITLEERCTVGSAALVNYGVVMGRGSTLAPDSFLMKGSTVAPGACWQGNPATEASAGLTAQVDPTLSPNHEAKRTHHGDL